VLAPARLSPRSVPRASNSVVRPCWHARLSAASWLITRLALAGRRSLVELNAERVPTVHGGLRWRPSTVRAGVLAQTA